MNNINYFYIDKQGNQQGPRSIEQLANACVITPNTMVWREGMVNWERAADVCDFNDILNQVPPPPPIINNNINQSPLNRPHTWLVENIVATLFCCFAFGIAGIVYASKVDGLWQAGKYEQARSAASTARLMLILSIVGVLIVAVLYLVLIFSASTFVGSSHILNTF